MSSEKSSHRKKTMFVDGPVLPAFISDSIAKHADNHAIGAHQIFLGQIRAQEPDGSRISSIDFTAYREMADDLYGAFREVLFSRHQLTCMHVYHSLGSVQVGEINLFVFVSSRHRKDAIAACSELVEFIKHDVPVWGRILLKEDGHAWKLNTLSNP